jgi:hypothetical protein
MHNHLPIQDKRLSLLELFTGTIFANYNHLIRAHVFGFPVYVLGPRLQDAKKIPKWSVRSRRGIYLGVSKLHSSTVHLILNPETGTISPQYHCVFDDTFSTVWADGNYENSGKMLDYRQLINHPDPKIRKIWQYSVSNKFGRTMQGVGKHRTKDKQVKGTDTMKFIHNHIIPKNKKVTYARFVCDLRLQKDEIH